MDEYTLKILLAVLGLGVTILGVSVTIMTAKWSRRKDKLNIIEQLFAELQRFNEIALSNEKNLKAAVLSTNPEEEYKEDEARMVYVHFLRINRMFRAWMYFQHKIILEQEAKDIIISHARTLKSIPESKLRKMMQRGYPDQFTNYLVDIIQSLSRAEAMLESSSSEEDGH